MPVSWIYYGQSVAHWILRSRLYYDGGNQGRTIWLEDRDGVHFPDTFGVVLRQRRKVTAAKAALSPGLRERATVSLPRVSERPGAGARQQGGAWTMENAGWRHSQNETYAVEARVWRR